MNLQPVLAPCNRSNADLHVNITQNGQMLEIYWGTALLQRVPYDSSSMLFRIMAGVLVNLGFPFPQLEKAFPVCDKTLRKWGRALKAKTPAYMQALLSGHTARRQLSAEQEQYVRVRYTELKDDTPTYREQIRNELIRYWGKNVTGELLRPIFREVDGDNDYGNTESVHSDTQSEAATGDPGPDIDEGIPKPEAGCEEERNNDCAVNQQIDGGNSEPRNDCSVSEDIPPRSSDFAQHGEVLVQEPDPSVENNHPGSEYPAFTGHSEADPTDPSVVQQSVPANTSDAATEGSDAVADSEVSQNNACAENTQIDTGNTEERNDCSALLPPVIHTDLLHRRCRGVSFSHHAGLFTLLPWFQQAAGDAEAMVQQFTLQLLAGAPNWEQSKQLDFEGLSLLCPKVMRTPRIQSQWFKENAFSETIDAVFSRNAELINLRNETIFYFDPHTENYTGKFNTLLGWCGSLHRVEKALHLDFIHTEKGDPCYVRHFDNYEDMRQRFLVSREQFRALFFDPPPMTWGVDRGIWSIPFLQNLDALGDTFVTWEKDYTPGSWNRHDMHSSGKFTKWRIRNNSGDQRRYRFHWLEQQWDKVAGGRRFIVKAVNPEGRCIEVSIVTNHTTLSAEKVIWLMFNRWVQENDFSYLKRHFGIGELSERGVDAYAHIADELEDRQQENRQYKRKRSEKNQREKELSETLFKMRPLQEMPTLEELRAKEQTMQEELETLRTELDNLRTRQDSPPSETFIKRLQDRIRDLSRQCEHNDKKKQHAQKRDRLEEQARSIEQRIGELEEELRSIPRTESRIAALIEEDRVRLKLRSKPLADAVRITARNIFMQPLRIFRRIWDNHRNDHAVLRAVTRSAGFIIPHADRLEVVLYPQLNLQPAEWRKVSRLLEICEHKIREMQKPKGPLIVFTLCTSHKEVVKRMAKQS